MGVDSHPEGKRKRSRLCSTGGSGDGRGSLRHCPGLHHQRTPDWPGPERNSKTSCPFLQITRAHGKDLRRSAREPEAVTGKKNKYLSPAQCFQIRGLRESHGSRGGLRRAAAGQRRGPDRSQRTQAARPLGLFSRRRTSFPSPDQRPWKGPGKTGRFSARGFNPRKKTRFGLKHYGRNSTASFAGAAIIVSPVRKG